MGSFLFRGVTSLLVVLSASVYADTVLQDASVAECRDRHFLISTDLSFTGNHFWFEIIDKGVHKLEPNYAAECGYTLSSVNAKGIQTLRVSYFACHVKNKDDAEFTLQYRIVKLDERGRESAHPSQISCKPNRDWKPREVVCEENYMEVSVNWSMFRLPQTDKKEDWDVEHFGDTKQSERQIQFEKTDAKPLLLSFEEASNLGYSVTSSPHRIVFRSPYNKALAEIQMVDGVQVEMINATVFVRQNWILVAIETVPACAISPETFNGSHLGWTVPKILTPLTKAPSKFVEKALLMGVDGLVVDKASMKTLNYDLDVSGPLVTLSAPLWAFGGVNESQVMNNQYQSRYTILFYLQHLWADDVFEETEHRSFRVVQTSYIPMIPFTVDQTVIDERYFTVYLGNIPQDVHLTAVTLNGEPFTVPEAIQHGYAVTNVPHANGTHAYILRVPTDDPIVLKMHLGEGVVHFSLDINFTLDIIDQAEQYHHLASVVAKHKDYFSPVLNAICTEKGIVFKIDLKKLGYMWEVSVGSNSLTPELAAKQGYVLVNDSQTMSLEIPLFTSGYVYEDINLQQLYGTFGIVIRDVKAQKIAETIVKRCHFKARELIVCAADGVVTVVISTNATIPTVDPLKTTLLDNACRPKESDEARALFTFHVNTCGTKTKVDGNHLTYENEVMIDKAVIPAHQAVISRDSEFRLSVKCIYPINDVVRLYTDGEFVEEPHMSGLGSIARKYFDRWQKNLSNMHNGILRGSKSEDFETNESNESNETEEHNSAFPYVPVVGVTVAVLGTLVAALIKRNC